MALDVVGFSSVFLNISAWISCFILLDHLEEIPYHAARGSNVLLGRKISVLQHPILRIYGVGAVWRWVVWHWVPSLSSGNCTFCSILLHSASRSQAIYDFIFTSFYAHRCARLGLSQLQYFDLFLSPLFSAALPVIVSWYNIISYCSIKVTTPGL